MEHSLEYLLGWKHFPLFGRYAYVEMEIFLMIKILLSCRLSTYARHYFVHDRLYNMWEIAINLRRYLDGWRIHQMNMFLMIKKSSIMQVIYLCTTLLHSSSSLQRVSQPIYGGIYTFDEHGKRYFYPTWMVAWSLDFSFITSGLFTVFDVHMYRVLFFTFLYWSGCVLLSYTKTGFNV
jgi:hypothetical protein